MTAAVVIDTLSPKVVLDHPDDEPHECPGPDRINDLHRWRLLTHAKPWTSLFCFRGSDTGQWPKRTVESRTALQGLFRY
jgi:hypothetical protein